MAITIYTWKIHVELVHVWDCSRVQLYRGAINYNKIMDSFKIYFNLNNKQKDLSKYILKVHHSNSTIF